MQTQRVDITDTAWVEITQGSPIVLAEGGVAGSFLVHFANTQAEPDLDAPAHKVQTFTAPFDFTQFALVSGQRIWVRSHRGNAFLIVTRDIVVFTGFVPLGSDRLITSGGKTFLVQEA
jgi:hypothetical protein